MHPSHHCGVCGADLTRVGGEWVDALRGRVINCPRCATACVRVAEGWRDVRRWIRRLALALPMLVVSLAIIGMASPAIVVLSGEVAMALAERLSQLPIRMVIETGEADLLLRWCLSAVLVGWWLGLIHAGRPVRAVGIWLLVVATLGVGVATVLAILKQVGSTYQPVGVARMHIRLPLLGAVIVASALPMLVTAWASSVATLRVTRDRAASMRRRVRRRMDQRKGARSMVRAIGQHQLQERAH